MRERTGAKGSLLIHVDLHFEAGGVLILAAAAAHQAGILGRVGDLGDRARELPVTKGIDFKARLLPELDEHDIHLADVHARFHFIEIDNGHHIGAGHLGRADHPLTQLRVELAHRAVEG